MSLSLCVGFLSLSQAFAGFQTPRLKQNPPTPKCLWAAGEGFEGGYRATFRKASPLHQGAPAGMAPYSGPMGGIAQEAGTLAWEEGVVKGTVS